MDESSILFLDLEVVNEKVDEVGFWSKGSSLKTSSIEEACSFLEQNGFRIICGHNIFAFDLPYLQKTSLYQYMKEALFLDTLPISLLLFNEKSFHALPKPYKKEDNFKNDPLQDAKLTATLLKKALLRFEELPNPLVDIFYSLLHDHPHFRTFFHLIEEKPTKRADEDLLHYLKKEYGFNTETLLDMFKNNRVELSFIISLMTPLTETKSLPPYILHHYPNILSWQKRLVQRSFSEEKLIDFMNKTFGFAGFREFPRLNPTLEQGSFLSQKEIVDAALQEDSFIAILPTGGGKTFTFWLPALFRAQKLKTLSVVISPLQALIKDQVQNFHKQVANFQAIAISGYQNRIERSEAIEKVMNGVADILYIAPESLRSETIFKLLKNRVIDRFIIDEAHSLSTWGHDFRHDYFYIAEFIQDLLKHQPWTSQIPISCFTATAKPDVIKDIKDYFAQKLNLHLKEFIAKPHRTNLTYNAIPTEKEDQKYTKLLELLSQTDTPSLVYIPSSTKKCEEIAEKLSLDLAPKKALPFHSKLDKEIKTQTLKAYLTGEVSIIVATTAFGMGIDKPDIQTVIHYEISDSLENYAQEAGRGARDRNLHALCPILFDEKDLDKHFTTLNRAKVNASEVNAVFQVIKKIKSKKVSLSSREIAKRAGWDTEGSDESWDGKVKTALLELEREGYLERRRNKVRFFADAITKNAFDKLNSLESKMKREEFILLKEVLNTLLGRGKPSAVQADEIALTLGYKREEVARALLRLKELGIIEDGADMILYINKDAKEQLQKIKEIEYALLAKFEKEQSGFITIRSLNQYLILLEILKKEENETERIKELLRLWRSKENHFLFQRIDRQNDLWSYELRNKDVIKYSLESKYKTVEKILEFFWPSIVKERKKRVPIEFSLLKLSKAISSKGESVEKALLFLHFMNILQLAQGRFIYYAPMQIYKTEKFKNKSRYTKKEYNKRLKPYYERKTEAIHIMGTFAKKLQKNPKEANSFLSDYFSLNYDHFKRRYKLLKEEITRPLTKMRYEKIFGKLSLQQKRIIEDNTHDTILILAGPGSGKTRVLVHKIASLILKEDVNPNQFLMLTFSRSAASEFRERLIELIGSLAYEVEIRTFHSYALQLIGREVVEGEEDILKKAVTIATQQIKDGVIHPPFKSVLMLDEFQDINAETFKLVQTLYEYQEGAMRIIAVGDDDQCILESVNGADIKFFQQFIEKFGKGEGGFIQYSLLQNFRSTPQIITCAKEISSMLTKRIKNEAILPVKKSGKNVILLSSTSPSLCSVAVENFHTLTEEKKELAFLAFTNEEVAQLYSLLYEKGHSPTYIINRQGYKLKNLVEIYDFHQLLQSLEKKVLERRDFQQIWKMISKRYRPSKNLDILLQVIKKFLQEHQHFYLNLWENYLDEIAFEEFEQKGRVVVTTMHKSKGKEFDQVVAVIPKKRYTQEWIRLLYVAMTRAKEVLYLVTDDPIITEKLRNNPFVSYQEDRTYYHSPKIYTHLMSLRDVVLSTSYYSLNKRVVAGESLELQLPYLLYHNKRVEKLSKSAQEQLKKYIQNGFFPKEIEAEAVVYWKERQKNILLPHILAKIVLQQKS